MSIRLSTLTAWVVGSVAVLGVGASAALVHATNVLHDTSATLLNAAKSINAAQELEGHLLDHARASVLWEVSGESSHLSRRALARDELEAWYREVETHVTSLDEGRLVITARQAVDRYLDERDRLEAQHVSPLDMIARIEPFLHDAHGHLERLTKVNVDQATLQYLEAERVDRRANLTGIVVVALIMLTIPLVLVLLTRLVFQPLRAIDRSIRRLGSGAREETIGPLATGVAELRTVAATIRDMAHDLARQRDGRLRYLAAVAHDLKNPIAAIHMGAEVIEQDADLDGETRDFVKVIYRQSAYLNRMVEDLLDTTRIESGNLELSRRRQDLRGVVADCVELFRNYSPTHRLIVTPCDVPLSVDVDALRISQVVNNLISNAIKYSPLGGDVVIGGACVDGEARLTVGDAGTGISAEEIDQIFEPFKRSRATKDTIPGVGLGLFTARKILKAHGGRIEVKSEVGVGSCFTIALPLAIRADLPRQSTESPFLCGKPANLRRV